MSHLQVLKESLKSASPSYINFLYRYNPKKKQVFAFYEGDEDPSFYNKFLESTIGSDCELEDIVVGCKNDVIKLQKCFDWNHYNKNQIAFFVDRDLSYWLSESTNYDENIFVTDEYSIENYIVNSQGFKSWLTRFEGFARASKKDIDSMVSQYKMAIVDFKKKMMPIMAEAVVAKRNDSSIRLKDFKITPQSVIFYVNDGCLNFKIIRSEKVFNTWKLTPQHRTEIDEQIKCFIKNIDHYSVRGKWILGFMAEIGEYMRLHPAMFAPSLEVSSPLRPTCSVPSSQCFSALAPYAISEIPPRLDQFLNNTYRIYLQNYNA